MGQSGPEWFKRKIAPPSGQVPLGGASEYWDTDPLSYEGGAELAAYFRSRGERLRKWELAARLSMHLLDDVLVAAEGLEHAVEDLRRIMADVAAWVAEHDLKGTPGLPSGVQHPAVTQAWYAFANVLFWARNLDERLDRPPPPRSMMRRQGLRPAVRPKRLANRVVKLVTDLRAGPLGETRFLANFTLHAAMVRHPHSGAGIDASGVVRLPIPDVQTKRIPHWYLLTWTQSRDAVTYTEQLWQSVQEFVDALLDAFDAATPRRLRVQSEGGAG